MIDNLNGFYEGILLARDNNELYTNPHTTAIISFSGLMFCPRCGDVRRVVVQNKMNTNDIHIEAKTVSVSKIDLPLLFTARCLQCQSNSTLVIYNGPSGTEMAVLHDAYGGCVTSHTPEEIKYYIDQGFRSQSVGAYSASIAMYRSALEWILYQHGYHQRMLGPKIETLVKDIQEHKAPDWAYLIQPEILSTLKDLGDGSIHTNDGDITKQDSIDKNLIELVNVVFSELLNIIYEDPYKRADRLQQLKNISAIFKNNKKL